MDETTNNNEQQKNAAITPFNTEAKIIQSNNLVEGCYSLSDVEQRLVFAMISQLDPNAEEFKEKNLKIKEIAKFCNLNEKSAYRQIDQALDNLSHQSLILKYKDKDGFKKGKRRPWFDTLDNDEKKGVLTFKFHNYLAPELIQLNQLKYGFVSVDGRLIGKLDSEFARRFYLLFLQYMNIGHRAFTISNIIELFMLENKYTDKRTNKVNTSMMLKRVVYPSIDKINQSTPMKVDYELQKIGKTITGIDFWFHMKNQNKPKETDIPDRAENREWRENNDVSNICNKLINLGFDGNQINDILSPFDNADDFMTAAQAAIQSLNNSKNIKRPGGFLRKFILRYDIKQQKLLAAAAEEERVKITEEKRKRLEIIESAATWEVILNLVAEQNNKADAITILEEAAKRRIDLLTKYKSAYSLTFPDEPSYEIETAKTYISLYGPSKNYRRVDYNKKAEPNNVEHTKKNIELSKKADEKHKNTKIDPTPTPDEKVLEMYNTIPEIEVKERFKQGLLKSNPEQYHRLFREPAEEE